MKVAPEQRGGDAARAGMRRWSPRWMAATASTIVSELISSTNELTDVNGMS